MTSQTNPEHGDDVYPAHVVANPPALLYLVEIVHGVGDPHVVYQDSNVQVLQEGFHLPVDIATAPEVDDQALRFHSELGFWWISCSGE